MAFTATALAYLISIVFFFGQLARFQLFGRSFPIIDILLVNMFFFNIVWQIRQKNKINNIWFVFFLLWTAFGLAFFRTTSITPYLYFIRLTSLLSFFIFPNNNYLFNPKTINFFSIVLIANIVFGIIQYIFWPDFRYFDVYQWDPHWYRLISTFFDPTFTGLIYLLFLINLYFLNSSTIQNPLLIISYISLALTYSRSSLLSFLFVAIFQKKFKTFFISFCLVVISVLILPRQPGEGTKLERTSSIKAKIENYQTAFSYFKQSPIIGWGYNRLPIVRTDISSNSHALGGFDGSLMTILVTTGIPGLLMFLLGWRKFFKESNLVIQTMLVAIFIHSLFANSWLYPWTIITLLFLSNAKYRT